MRSYQSAEVLEIILDKKKEHLQVSYAPRTERTLYDICDLHGRILKTGDVQKARTRIDLQELYDDQYILLILDGDKILSKRFRLDRCQRTA